MNKLLAFFLCLPAYSQSMVVNTTEGNSTVYATQQIESVTFSEETIEPTAATIMVRISSRKS